MAIHRQCG